MFFVLIVPDEEEPMLFRVVEAAEKIVVDRSGQLSNEDLVLALRGVKDS